MPHAGVLAAGFEGVGADDLGEIATELVGIGNNRVASLRFSTAEKSVYIYSGYDGQTADEITAEGRREAPVRGSRIHENSGVELGRRYVPILPLQHQAGAKSMDVAGAPVTCWVRFCSDQGRASAGRCGIVRNVAEPEPQEVVVANRLIHAELILLLILVERRRIDGVVQAVQPRPGGWKSGLGKFYEVLIDEARRDTVSRKRVAREGTGCGSRTGGVWVEDLIRNVAQIAVVVGLGRDAKERVGRLAEQKLLKCAVEERLVLAVIDFGNVNGSAQGKAKLVLLERSYIRLESVARIEGVVAKVFPHCTVRRVGAGLGNDVNNAAGGTAELRLVIVGIDLEFLNSVNDGGHHVGADHALVVDTVKHEKIAAVGLAVDGRENKLAALGFCDPKRATGILGDAHRRDASRE